MWRGPWSIVDAAWLDWNDAMTSSKIEKIRAAVAEEAAEWFVANDTGPLDAGESAALIAWLKTSPMHVEEFLRAAVIARDLGAAGAGLGAIEDLIVRAQSEDGQAVPRWWSRTSASVRSPPRWRTAMIAVAAIGVISLGVLWLSKLGLFADRSAASGITALNFSTRHGEQQTQRLPDNSVLHINTDSAIAVRYSRTERIVVLESGEADFEVAHESARTFRVFAGPAVATAHGTQFDVRLTRDLTVITVIEGRVGVGRSGIPGGTSVGLEQIPRSVELYANQQISVSQAESPSAPISVDAHRSTAWLRKQIVFDHQPLDQVAAEYNRYAAKPIEITTPELGKLEISGTVSTEDSEEFVAFLRSLEGVRVEVTTTRILVSKN